jgi:hypothetical protein
MAAQAAGTYTTFQEINESFLDNNIYFTLSGSASNVTVQVTSWIDSVNCN